MPLKMIQLDRPSISGLRGRAFGLAGLGRRPCLGRQIQRRSGADTALPRRRRSAAGLSGLDGAALHRGRPARRRLHRGDTRSLQRLGQRRRRSVASGRRGGLGGGSAPFQRGCSAGLGPARARRLGGCSAKCCCHDDDVECSQTLYKQKSAWLIFTDTLMVQVEQSIRLCLCVRTITFELMVFDPDIWYAGSSCYYLGQVRRSRSWVNGHNATIGFDQSRTCYTSGSSCVP